MLGTQQVVKYSVKNWQFLRQLLCFFVPIGVCPVVPDIHFKDSYTFLDPSFTESKENNFNCTAISIQDLVGLCSLAPFGRHEKTVVDKTVRSCWQMDPEKFTIANTITSNKAFSDLKSAASSVLAPELNSNQDCNSGFINCWCMKRDHSSYHIETHRRMKTTLVLLFCHCQ